MYYYPGHRIQNQFCTPSALSPLPGEHSGQSPFYRRAQCQLNHNIVRILPGPHLTPGSRAAMWIKCLAEGQKCTGRQWDSNPGSQRESRAVTPLYHGTSVLEGRLCCMYSRRCYMYLAHATFPTCSRVMTGVPCAN